MSDLQVRSTQASMPIPSGWLSSALPIAKTCHHHDDKGRGAMCPSRRGLGGLQYLTGIVTFAYEQHHADTINVRRVGYARHRGYRAPHTGPCAWPVDDNQGSMSD